MTSGRYPTKLILRDAMGHRGCNIVEPLDKLSVEHDKSEKNLYLGNQLRLRPMIDGFNFCKVNHVTLIGCYKTKNVDLGFQERTLFGVYEQVFLA